MLNGNFFILIKKELKDIVDKLCSFIPGYDEYLERKDIKTKNRKVRGFVSKKLQESLLLLDQKEQTSEIHQLRMSFRLLESKISTATGGTNTVMNSQLLTNEALLATLELDKKLLLCCNQLYASVKDKELKDVYKSFSDLEEIWRSRAENLLC